MLSKKSKYTRILFTITILFISGGVYSQVNESDIEYYDTSEYVPSSYKSSLDYNLMIAASKGYSLEVERLIQNGADPDAETYEGVTSLIFAVAGNQTKIVNLLIEYGADVNKVTSKFETPLLIAVKGQNEEIAEALVRAGADIDFSDRHDATPLHYASIYGYFQLVDMLLYYGASVDKKSAEGITPLLASIWAGYNDVADLLIQNGANMEAKDNDGFTPFLMTALYGDTLMMDLLYKKGVDIYASNNLNHNALTLSIIAGHTEAVSYLLKLGNKWTNSGKVTVNPYIVATKYHRTDIINILKNNNVPGQLNYKIDQFAITVSSRVFINDFYNGISFSFKEPYLNAGFIVGFDTKLWYTRVLVKKEVNLFYQYMDKGSVAYAGLFKDFALSDPAGKFSSSISTSLLAGYSFGNMFKGTLIAPKNKFIIIPSVSFKMTKMNFSFNIGLEYLKTEFYHNGPVWLRVGFSYNHYFDNIRVKTKTIKWY